VREAAVVERQRSRVPAQATAILAIAASALGLLCVRIEPFDDGALLMGARMVRAGNLPYRDFYTLYGPFGYTLQGWALGVLGNPPLGLRAAQAVCLAGVGLLALLVDRRTAGARGRGWAVLLFVAALSAAALLASFFAFAFAAASLLCFALAVAGPPGGGASSRGARWAACGGALLALCGLTRPAFALYTGAALAVVLVLAGGAFTRRHAVVGAIAALTTLVVLWAALYPAVSWRAAWEAAIRAPGRLATGGGRYHQAPFLQASTPITFVWGATFLAALLPWAFAAGRRSVRIGLAVVVLVGGLSAVWLRGSAAPGRDATLLGAATLALVGAAAVLERRALAASPRLGAAALLGVAAAAFTHYFWARQDRAHVVPLVALAAGSAAFALDSLRVRDRLVTAGLLVLLAAPVGLSAVPIAALWDGSGARLIRNARRPGATARTIWPCAEVPADAAQAVALADRVASRSSRFVAVGSSQAGNAINPVLLFLLSSRPPYTRWYTYDPGVQDAPSVQAEMEQSLAASGSASAVVWRVAETDRTPFDQAFDRLYPNEIARFGDYEVRSREPSAAPR
jgi:hypothetical protein